MDIDDWRLEIDRIDDELVNLLNRRSRCAIEIGRIKRWLGLPIYSPEREAEVVAHVIGRNGGPLEQDAIKRLFERIIDESRRIERTTIQRESEEQERGAKKKGTERARKRKGSASGSRQRRG